MPSSPPRRRPLLHGSVSLAARAAVDTLVAARGVKVSRILDHAIFLVIKDATPEERALIEAAVEAAAVKDRALRATLTPRRARILRPL